MKFITQKPSDLLLGAIGVGGSVLSRRWVADGCELAVSGRNSAAILTLEEELIAGACAVYGGLASVQSNPASGN